MASAIRWVVRHSCWLRRDGPTNFGRCGCMSRSSCPRRSGCCQRVTTPCLRGLPGVATASIRWTRLMRTIGPSRRSTNCIPLLSGPMSMAASRPLRTARSRCGAGRPLKPRSFATPRPAVHGTPSYRSKYRWPLSPDAPKGLGPEHSRRSSPQPSHAASSWSDPTLATLAHWKTPQPWPKTSPSGSEPILSRWSCWSSPRPVPGLLQGPRWFVCRPIRPSVSIHPSPNTLVI